jgi:hypothetical protein
MKKYISFHFDIFSPTPVKSQNHISQQRWKLTTLKKMHSQTCGARSEKCQVKIHIAMFWVITLGYIFRF